AKKQRPTASYKKQRRPQTNVRNAFAQLVQETRHFAFVPDLGSYSHGVTSSPHEQIQAEGKRVTQKVDEQHATQPDVVVYKTDHRPGTQPSALEAGEQKTVGLGE